MKYLLILGTAVALLLTSACKKDSYPSAADFIGDITGTYEGNFVKNGIIDQDSAIAEVIQVDGGQVQIHCYNGNYDTTFNMDVYYNNDSIMVCATGDTFEGMYGHMKGDSHMGDMMDGQNEWTHHMGDEHDSGDMHFGGFNMSLHSFGYTFQDGIGDSTQEIVFNGVRKN
ncbi:MAG: hypothetical protein GXO88_10840 [Chlorobi bacterium]|nr:hypothetical protein [Chlorobiota bacterium]